MIPAFTENWFGETSCEALADLYGRTTGPGRVIEVGSWEGRSTIALADACWPEILHAVDTWEGSPGEISASLAATRDVYGRWHANVYGTTAGNVVPFRMGWREYADLVGAPIRFLFVDAEHTYEEVRDTIDTFRGLMVPGGVICGDDVHHPPVRDAVLEAFGSKAMTIATLWYWQAP